MTQWLEEQEERMALKAYAKRQRAMANKLAKNLETFIEEFGFHAPKAILEPAEKALHEWKQETGRKYQ